MAVQQPDTRYAHASIYRRVHADISIRSRRLVAAGCRAAASCATHSMSAEQRARGFVLILPTCYPAAPRRRHHAADARQVATPDVTYIHALSIAAGLRCHAMFCRCYCFSFIAMCARLPRASLPRCPRYR